MSETLLIVDDEEEIRGVLSTLLGRLGYGVRVADCGQAALDLLADSAIDVVLSDLCMPRMTGLELLRRMGEAGHTQPFVLLTAFPSQDSTLQALRLGAFDYLEKPYDPDALATLLAEAARMGRAMRHLRGGAIPAGRGVEGEERAVQATTDATRLRAEVEPQLSFCAAAIHGLADPGRRNLELGYLSRVYQALAERAIPGGAGAGCAALATELARLCTALRVVTRYYQAQHGDLVGRGNAQLQAFVAGRNVPPREASRLLQDLAAAAERLERTVRTVGNH